MSPAATPSTPTVVNVEAATSVPVAADDVPVRNLRTRAGVKLAWGVIGLIGIFVGSMLGLMGLEEARTAADMEALREGLRTAPDSLGLLRQQVLLEATTTAQTASRAFWLELVKIVLTTLLPVLTALLGYIFGSREA